MTAIYLVGTEAGATGFCSLARRIDAPHTMTAYSTARAAALAASASDLYVPGFLIGETSPMAMSTIAPIDLVERVRKLGIDKELLEVNYYEPYNDASFWPRRPIYRLIEDLAPDMLRALLSLFDRRSDSRAIGDLTVYRIELSE